MRKIDATLESVTGFASLTADNVLAGANKITGKFTLTPAAVVTPSANGDLTFSASSNTTVTVRLKGSDGIVRASALTLNPES